MFCISEWCAKVRQAEAFESRYGRDIDVVGNGEKIQAFGQGVLPETALAANIRHLKGVRTILSHAARLPRRLR